MKTLDKETIVKILVDTLGKYTYKQTYAYECTENKTGDKLYIPATIGITREELEKQALKEGFSVSPWVVSGIIETKKP